MFEQRNRQVDLLALTFLVLAVFMSLSMLTYDRADPPVELLFPLNHLYQQDALVHPVNTETSNLCGRLGSLSASLLWDAIGLGAFYFVLSLGIVTAQMLRGRTVSSPSLRFVGWMISLIALTALLSMVFSTLTPGPVVGAGGYLGAIGHGLLRNHFAAVGGFILAFSMFIAGLLLCTDYVLLHLGLIAFATVADRCVKPGRKRSRRNVAIKEMDEEEDTLAVRIRGRRVRPSHDDDEQENEDDDLAPDDSSEEVAEDEEYDWEEELDEEEETPASEASDELIESSPMIRRRGNRRRLFGSSAAKRQSDEREQVMQQLDEATVEEQANDYELPSVDLLHEPDDISYDSQEREVRRKAKILEQTFENFGFSVKVVEIETGPVIAQYEVELEAGLRLSRITGLADDLAIALRVPSVRIVAPIPGKNTVGIEVPNAERHVVRLREVMEESTSKIRRMRIPLFLGKDVSGNPLAVDLSSMPHLLIAGRTGTGKSVCLNAIISSILMTRRPDEVRLLMIDPKMVELSGYRTLPHLMHPVVTDMRKAEAILAWAVDKMEERYALLARAGVRHISGYNQLDEEEVMRRLEPETEEERDAIPLHMPYIVIVADEIADLMMTAGKEVEQHIIRLAQKSRAVGIHLILATQKPTVDVITGLIKSNLPARIAFQVASRTDSRVVLDEMGADKLLGSGDMLLLWPGTSTLLRGQGTYLADEEIDAVVQTASQTEQEFVKELVELKVEDESTAGTGQLKKRDDLYENAVEIVIREGRGSVSLLQRSLGIGYGRAARLIDFMAEDGIVGQYAGSQAREVLMSMEDFQRAQANSETSDAHDIPRPRRSNKIRPHEPPEAKEAKHQAELAAMVPAPSKLTSKARRPAVAMQTETEQVDEGEDYDEAEEAELEDEFTDEQASEEDEDDADDQDYEYEDEDETDEYEDEDGEGDGEYDDDYDDEEYDDEEWEDESNRYEAESA